MTWLVTGGAGFIGTNLALQLDQLGEEVLVVDDLSREGSANNWDELRENSSARLIRGSIADPEFVHRIGKETRPSVIVHLAGQVSLMRSIYEPHRDFEINAYGTLLLLEQLRTNWPNAKFIYSSTNKVYGDLEQYQYTTDSTRYRCPALESGVDTEIPLSFHGPYSCSKGAADQYVADYHRIYGLDTFVLRQSAISGKFQHPRSDQGWAAFLAQETLAGRTIQLNGRGLQVRDLLDVEDLSRLFITIGQSETNNRRVFNVGGGAERAVSLIEFFDLLRVRGHEPRYMFGPERPSDQKIFVSDNDPLQSQFGWTPTFSLDEIVDRLIKFATRR